MFERNGWNSNVLTNPCYFMLCTCILSQYTLVLSYVLTLWLESKKRSYFWSMRSLVSILLILNLKVWWLILVFIECYIFPSCTNRHQKFIPVHGTSFGSLKNVYRLKVIFSRSLESSRISFWCLEIWNLTLIDHLLMWTLR